MRPHATTLLFAVTLCWAGSAGGVIAGSYARPGSAFEGEGIGSVHGGGVPVEEGRSVLERGTVYGEPYDVQSDVGAEGVHDGAAIRCGAAQWASGTCD